VRIDFAAQRSDPLGGILGLGHAVLSLAPRLDAMSSNRQKQKEQHTLLFNQL
jgi:hypothetical protein